jgi:hypothetical protein
MLHHLIRAQMYPITKSKTCIYNINTNLGLSDCYISIHQILSIDHIPSFYPIFINNVETAVNIHHDKLEKHIMFLLIVHFINFLLFLDNMNH